MIDIIFEFYKNIYNIFYFFAKKTQKNAFLKNGSEKIFLKNFQKSQIFNKPKTRTKYCVILRPSDGPRFWLPYNADHILDLVPLPDDRRCMGKWGVRKKGRFWPEWSALYGKSGGGQKPKYDRRCMGKSQKTPKNP